MFKSYAYLILFILSTSTHCIAMPTIQQAGTIYHNHTTIIKGTQFGVKKVASPLLFENFEKKENGEETTVGNTVPKELTYWTGRGGTLNGHPKDIVVSDAKKRHSASSRAAASYLARSFGVDLVNQQAWINDIGLASTGKIYLNMWIYWQWVENPIYRAGDTYYQIKSFNLSTEHAANGDVVSPYLTEFIGYWYQPPSYGSTYTQGYHRSGRVSHAGQVLYYNNSSIPHNFAGWVNVILVSDTGTNINDASITDGWRIAYISSPGLSTAYQKKIETNKNYLDDESKGPHPIDSLKIGWFLGNNLSTGNTTLYYDDIYVDNTFSRVEIGNASTYDNCTHREIQIPVTWSDNEITFITNTAAFNKEDKLYLYVINQDNVTNEKGYELESQLPPHIIDLTGNE